MFGVSWLERIDHFDTVFQTIKVVINDTLFVKIIFSQDADKSQELVYFPQVQNGIVVQFDSRWGIWVKWGLLRFIRRPVVENMSKKYMNGQIIQTHICRRCRWRRQSCHNITRMFACRQAMNRLRCKFWTRHQTKRPFRCRSSVREWVRTRYEIIGQRFNSIPK